MFKLKEDLYLGGKFYPRLNAYQDRNGPVIYAGHWYSAEDWVYPTDRGLWGHETLEGKKAWCRSRGWKIDGCVWTPPRIGKYSNLKGLLKHILPEWKIESTVGTVTAEATAFTLRRAIHTIKRVIDRYPDSTHILTRVRR